MRPLLADMSERLYLVDFRAHEVEKRELWLDVFTDELAALHEAGFVHRDLRRPSGIGGQYFDSVLLTDSGLRLVDVGIAALRHQVGEQLFRKYIEMEREEMLQFGEYFLNR